MFPKAPPPPQEALEDPKILALVDERLSLDQITNTWIFHDGENEYEYDYDEKKYVLRGATGSKRSREDAEINKEEELNKAELKRLKKERLAELKQEIADLKAKKEKSDSTAVFVSQLPDDVTRDELVGLFSKYGVLAEDFASGEPRIKMYYENDAFKNEALVIYLAKESVDLAVEMLHDTPLRPGKDISVERAQFEASESRSVMSEEQKKLMRQKKEQMKKKLTNWDDDKPSKYDQIKRKLFDKIVVVEGMFRADEMKQDPMLEMDIKEDIQEECERLAIGSDITKVTVYDKVVTIKFVKPELSLKCVEGFDGRFFDGLKLKAYRYNGESL